MPKDIAVGLRRSSRLSSRLQAAPPSPAPVRGSSASSPANTVLAGLQRATLPPWGGIARPPVTPPQPQLVTGTPAPIPTCNKAQRRQWREIVISSMVLDIPRFAYLISSRLPGATAAIVAHVTSVVAEHPELPPLCEPPNYLGWVINTVSDPEKSKDFPTPPELAEAAASRKASAKPRRRQRRQLNVLFFTPEDYGRLTLTIVTFYVDKLPDDQVYPPPGAWVAENQLLYDTWYPYLSTYRLPDRRRHRSPTILLDHSKLQYIMPADLNFLIFDKTTKDLVFKMVRDFCPSREFLEHGRSVVHETVMTKNCIRKEDQGVIVQIGFTAGSRGSLEFGWARNTLSKKTDQHAANRKISSFMTGFWLIAKHIFKGEIPDDFADFYQHIPRFHPDWPRCDDAAHGPLELPPSCGDFKWDGVELAPGCAVMVQRYARAVHMEHQPHRWALNWTTLREGTNPQGGNFVLAKYGILIRQSANSAFAWRPQEWHATTLALFDPKGDNPRRSHSTFDQHSVAFVTSPRIVRAYKEWELTNSSCHWEGGPHGFLSESGDEVYGY